MVEPFLAPCPFCRGGSTSFRDNQFWTGRSFQLISAEIHHWCVRQEGAPQSHIVIGGRDRQHAAALWNAAAPVTVPGETA